MQGSLLTYPCLPAILPPRSKLFYLASLPASERWSLALHQHHPAAFKAAAQALLLASHRASPGPAKQEGSRRQGQKAAKSVHTVGLHALPHDVVLHILSLAGSDIASWAALSGL